MKYPNFIYLFILLTVFSCSTFEKFDHFGIGNTFEESFEVDIPFSNNMSFLGSVEFAASDDATIQDNIDNIQEFEVTQISLKITNYVGNSGAVGNGSFMITSNGNSVGDAVQVSNLNFTQLFASEELMELPLTQATYNAIETAYRANETLTIEASGEISGATENLQIEFTVYMSIEATIGSQ